MSASVYIVILNWNGYKDTIECLRSLQKLIVKDFNISIVVVDNASTNDSVKQIKKVFKEIKIIENKNNLGFAGGNNVGIKYALENRADYILILNNDTLVDPNLVVEFLEVAKKHPKAGVLTAKIYFAPGYEYHKKYHKLELGKVIWSAGGDIDWKNVYGSNHGVDEVDKDQFSRIRETDFATGACSFYRADVLKKVGLYDEKYYLYLEDLELSQRIKAKKWDILYVPKAVVWHKVSQSSAIGGELNDYFITRNRLLFGIKYAPIRAKAALIRESTRLLRSGRKWQKVGVKDYYRGKFGKGSWN